MNNPRWLDYVPVPLAFGTSGMRGLVVDLTDLEAYISVGGALRYLLSIGDIRSRSTIVVGGDLRPSTDRILAAVVLAIRDCDLDVEYAGRLPSPALLFHAMQTSRASVMVTGSHIPFDRNGIKVNKRVGELLKSDEPGVLACIAAMREQVYAGRPFVDGKGMLAMPSLLPTENPEAQQRYVQRYTTAFPSALAGLRLAFYAHSAVGREIVPRVLQALGAAVFSVGRSDTFVPIDTEALGADQLATLQRLVDDVQAAHGRIDAIVSTDGDSDRPLVCAIADGKVRFMPGDRLGLVVAEYLRADAVSVPVSSNDAIAQRLSALGVVVAKTKIGSPYVVASMEAQREAGHRRVMGWEANGGFLVADEIDDFAPLPTRDAVLPIVANLAQARALGVTLDASWQRLPQRASRAGLLDQFPVESSRAILRRLILDDTIEVTPPAWPATFALLQSYFASCGTLTRINALDGVRMYFDSGEVAHLRPSGNAPQLRIYAEATTQARADEIVAQALAEPDGILRRLERELVA